MITTELVNSILASVEDPKSRKPLTESSRIENIEVKEDFVNVILKQGTLTSDEKNKLTFACLEAFYKEIPKAQVNVHFDQTKMKAHQEVPVLAKNVIAVASGKGGVGKSTVSANLALGLHQLGYRTGLIDADIYGPSMPTMFGTQDVRPMVVERNGQHVLTPIQAYGVHMISIGNIIDPEQAVVLRGPRLSGVLKQFIKDCLWPELDFMIIDLPPGTGDVQLSLVQTVPVSSAIIVTTPQEVAVADAIKAANMFMLPNINVPILGVVENMSYFTPEELPNNRYEIFGSGGGEKLASFTKTPLLAQVPLIMGIREAGDSGKPSVIADDVQMSKHFKELSEKVMYYSNKRNEDLPESKPVEINS